MMTMTMMVNILLQAAISHFTAAKMLPLKIPVPPCPTMLTMTMTINILLEAAIYHFTAAKMLPKCYVCQYFGLIC